MISEFLTAIWGDPLEGVGELRTMKDGLVGSGWYRIIPAAARAASDFDADGYDVYFGVLPRLSSRGTSDNCPDTTSVLWADVDAKNTGGRWTGLVGVRQLPQHPSIIVDSGHGLHCYWLLREPVEYSLAKSAMKHLAHETQGDAVHDKARILRVPGTTNRKEIDRPVAVRLLFWDVERKYRIEDFAGAPEKWSDMGTADWDRVSRNYNNGIHSSIPSWLSEKIADGAPRGLRSEAAFSTVIWLLRYGWSNEDIFRVFESSEAGIGEKFHELGKDGPRWLNRTIDAAVTANA